MMDRSLLCLAVTGDTLEKNVGVVAKHRADIDIVELRSDFLQPEEFAYLDKFPELVDCPVIFTLRRASDEGKFTGSERERRSLVLRALKGGYRYIDREGDVVDPDLDAEIDAAGVQLIRSLHDFTGVPKDLAHRVKSLKARETDILKAAVMPRSTRDVVRIIRCSRELHDYQKIIIGMGDFGLLTRILATPLGSQVCFCSHKEQQAAPGHMSPEELAGLYRFRNIDADTQIFGIIGNPVMHTSSPNIHNRGFAGISFNAVYIPLLVDDLEAFFEIADLLNIQGVSVTIPHKEDVLPYLTEEDDCVRSTRACNTLLRKQKGWHGTNTDINGFVKPLLDVYGGAVPEDLHAGVVGAGGAARAVVFALRKYGASVAVINRSAGRAETLAQAFQCEWGGIDSSGIELLGSYADLIVQTTSVGMAPETDIEPLPDYQFKGSEVVYDLVYKPQTTRFLGRAARAGCRTISGIEMLYEQAYAQFRLFTGKSYPDSEKHQNTQS